MIQAVAKQETKTIHGNDYLYLTYYDSESKRKKTVYCGPKDDLNSTRKAIEKEIEIIDAKITECRNRKTELKRQLQKNGAGGARRRASKT